MPNLMQGTLKIKGTKEKLLEVLKELEAFEYEEDESWKEFEMGEINARSVVINAFLNCFLDKSYFDYSITDADNGIYIICLGGLQFGWGLNIKAITNFAKKHELDLKVHGYEFACAFEEKAEFEKGELKYHVDKGYDSDAQMVWECEQPFNTTF